MENSILNTFFETGYVDVISTTNSKGEEVVIFDPSEYKSLDSETDSDNDGSCVRTEYYQSLTNANERVSVIKVYGEYMNLERLSIEKYYLQANGLFEKFSTVGIDYV